VGGSCLCFREARWVWMAVCATSKAKFPHGLLHAHTTMLAMMCQHGKSWCAQHLLQKYSKSTKCTRKWHHVPSALCECEVARGLRRLVALCQRHPAS